LAAALKSSWALSDRRTALGFVITDDPQLRFVLIELPAGYRVVKDSVLGGLHHEYRLVKEAA
jgi:hypothetical protein